MFPNMHLCDVLKRKIYIVSEEQFPEDCEIMITQWLFEVIFHHLQQKYVIRFLRRKKFSTHISLQTLSIQRGKRRFFGEKKFSEASITFPGTKVRLGSIMQRRGLGLN